MIYLCFLIQDQAAVSKILHSYSHKIQSSVCEWKVRVRTEILVKEGQSATLEDLFIREAQVQLRKDTSTETDHEWTHDILASS